MGFLSNLFGGGPKTTLVQSKIPEELAPYVTEVNKEQQELYRRRLAERPETYQYQGQTIADLTQDQLDARGGIRGLVGSTADDYALARQGITGGDEKFKTDISPERIDALQRGDYDRIDPTVAARGVDFTGAPTGFTSERFQEKDISEYMNPYQRAVTDIEKRKAQEDFAKLMPEFEKQAISMGGMSGMGSRAGVQAGLMGQKQMQRLGDLEKTGLLEAYQDAQARKAEDFDKFRDQRSFEERERSFLKGERDYLTGLDIGNIDRQRGERAFDVGFDRDQQGFLRGERDFEKGERAFEAQQFADRKKRERQQSQDLQSLAKGRYGQQMREYGALESLGADAEKRSQRGLDRSYADWLERRERPETLLGRYTSAIYGNPMLAKPSQTTTTPGVPFGQQMLGIGTAIAGAGGFNPFFGAKAGATGGGIASLMPTVYRDNGGMITVGDVESGFNPNVYDSDDPVFTADRSPFSQTTHRIKNLDRVIRKEKDRLNALQENLAAGDTSADAQAKKIMTNLQQNLLPKRSELVGNVSAKKFQESAKKFPEEIKTKDKDIAAAYDQARRRRTGGDQSEAAVSNQSYKNDFAKSLINQGKFTPDPLKQDIYKDILVNWKDYLAAQKDNLKNKTPEAIKEQDTALKNQFKLLQTNYLERIKNIDDNVLKDLRKSMPPKSNSKENLQQLVVMMGLKGATHKEGFIAGATEAYLLWKKQNNVNEKEARLMDREVAKFKATMQKTLVGKQYDYSKFLLQLDEKTRDAIRKLPNDKAAILMQQITMGEKMSKIMDTISSFTGTKPKQIDSGQTVEKIRDRLFLSKPLRKIITGKGMISEAAKLEDEAGNQIAAAISALAYKQLMANPKIKKAGRGNVTYLENKIISNIITYSNNNSLENTKQFLKDLLKHNDYSIPKRLS